MLASRAGDGGVNGSHKATKPQRLSRSVRPEPVEACPERLQGSRRGPLFFGRREKNGASTGSARTGSGFLCGFVALCDQNLYAPGTPSNRSDERRAGTECVSTCRSRASPYL